VDTHHVFEDDTNDGNSDVAHTPLQQQLQGQGIGIGSNNNSANQSGTNTPYTIDYMLRQYMDDRRRDNERHTTLYNDMLTRFNELIDNQRMEHRRFLDENNQLQVHSATISSYHRPHHFHVKVSY
jgi:hypothetical protein